MRLGLFLLIWLTGYHAFSEQLKTIICKSSNKDVVIFNNTGNSNTSFIRYTRTLRNKGAIDTDYPVLGCKMMMNSKTLSSIICAQPESSLKSLQGLGFTQPTLAFRQMLKNGRYNLLREIKYFYSGNTKLEDVPPSTIAENLKCQFE